MRCAKCGYDPKDFVGVKAAGLEVKNAQLLELLSECKRELDLMIGPTHKYEHPDSELGQLQKRIEEALK